MEDYLTILPKSMYITFAKFRTGNHRFPIEVGRCQNIELAERKCTLCNTGDIGNEMHYLLICPFFLKKELCTYRGITTRARIPLSLKKL